MKYKSKNEYEFVLYHLNIDGDVRIPYDNKNIIAKIRFSYYDGKLKKIKYYEKKEKVSLLIKQLEAQLLYSKSVPPPPPPQLPPPPPPPSKKR